jgi:Bacterial HORMA domain family 1
MSTFTTSNSESFTIAHARKLTSKVVADMTRCSQIYGRPVASFIQSYGEELSILLRDGYVKSYEFGFQRNNIRVLSWFYTVDASSAIIDDARPGGIVASANVASAEWFNYLIRSQKWWNLPKPEREKIDGSLPIRRVGSDGPQDGNGYWEIDRNYSAGGVTLARRTYKPVK